MRRLRPLIAVAAWTAAALAALDLALVGASGFARPALRQAEVLDPGEYERIGQQIAAAERQLAVKPAASRSLVVVAGLSTAREDIDAETLGRAMCGGSRLLNLGSSGGSFRELAFYLRPLAGSTLSSSLTVLAVHPVWLAGRLNTPTAAEPGADQSAEGGRQSLLRRLRGFQPWILANRRAVHALVMDALWWVRYRLASRFALPPHEIFAGGHDSPWTPRLSYHGARATDRIMQEQLDAWRGFGWFDAGSFSATGTEAVQLRRVLEEVQSVGGPVVVVLMPEHTTMRELVPDAAERTFRAALGRENYRALLDFRSALPDKDFYDYAHLNAHGRRQLSLLLARRLASFPSCRGPLRSTGEH